MNDDNNKLFILLYLIIISFHFCVNINDIKNYIKIYTKILKISEVLFKHLYYLLKIKQLIIEVRIIKNNDKKKDT